MYGTILKNVCFRCVGIFSLDICNSQSPMTTNSKLDFLKVYLYPCIQTSMLQGFSVFHLQNSGKFPEGILRARKVAHTSSLCV